MTTRLLGRFLFGGDTKEVTLSGESGTAETGGTGPARGRSSLMSTIRRPRRPYALTCFVRVPSIFENESARLPGYKHQDCMRIITSQKADQKVMRVWLSDWVNCDCSESSMADAAGERTVENTRRAYTRDRVSHAIVTLSRCALFASSRRGASGFVSRSGSYLDATPPRPP